MKFAFHTLGIRTALIDVLGADNLAIRVKVRIKLYQQVDILTCYKVLENFEPHKLANLGRTVSDVVSSSVRAS